MKKHDNGSRSSDDDDNNNNNSDSEETSSSSSSGDDSGSESSSESAPSPKKKGSVAAATAPDWSQDPDLYGIRRSGRSRKEPETRRLDDDSEEEEGEGSPRYSKPLKKNEASVWNEDSSYTESDEKGSYVPPSRPIFRKKNSAAATKKGNRRGAKKPTPRKRRGSSSEDDGGANEEDYRRFSRRRKPDSEKPVSYVIPDSDEDIGEGDEDQVASWTYEDESNADPDGSNENLPTIEKILDHRKGKAGNTGAGTTLYNMKAGNDSSSGNQGEGRDLEMQYLINWKGLSHLHNTWESEDSLTEMGAKGMKKLNNFMSRLADYEAWKKLANPEDIEYNECQLEMSQQLITSHTIPDRIIAQRTGDEGGLEYYIKWKNLPYVEATWESGDLIDGEFESVIENFKFRQESRYAPSSKSKYLKYRPKFSSIKAQPDYMGGSDDSLKLRDYQLDGINWLAHAWCKQNSVILADEMGLGKTIQTVNFLYYLFHTHQLYGPFLVVVPLSTLDAWQKEFARWAPDINVLSYVGDAASRGIIREYEWTHPGNKRSKFNAILTTYEIVLKDKQYLNNVPYAVIMVDEAHRLKNDDSMLYKCLKDLTVYQRLLITGTPLQNSLKELWSLLHFIMPQKFDEWEEFNDQFGTSSAEKRGYTKLHKLLEPYILRRVKKDVEKSLPAKVERILRVDMSRKQKQYYKWILTRNYAALTKGVKGSTLSFVNIVMELKKCCNHVLLTRPEEMDSALSMSREEKLQFLLRGSGKLLLLDKLLVRLKETGHRVLIFSQMVRVLDILAEYLELRRFSFQRLDGGIKGELRKQALEHFNVPGSTDFCFLLSTRAGGLGINLATADTVIIFDSDWNPQNDLQAQARAHRIGQKDQVNVYRLVTMNSVEEDIIERAKKKMILDHLVIQRMDTTGTTILNKSSEKNSTPFSKEELSAILKFGAEDLFKDEDETGGDEEPKCDIDEILNRAETREEESGISSTGEEILSAFKVASFAVDEDEPITIEKSSSKPEKDWSDIIPQDILERVEEEERQKEIQELCLGPRNRKTVGDESSSKRKRSSEDEEDSDSESGKPSKKRGRPSGREKVTAGFTDTEVRRFVKSFKKFPKPISRLEAVATDAELQEKALGDLVKLGNALYERCNEAVHEAEPLKSKAVSIKLGNVAVNAKTLCESVHLLDPLASFLPLLPNEDDRSPWSKVKSLPFKYKDPGYDEIDWGMSDDVSLLKGVYIHGLGSWDSIKMDRDLDLRDKIMPNADRKPQAKHLDTRVAFLLRSLKKSQETGGGSGDKPAKKSRGSRAKKPGLSAVNNENSGESKGESEGGKYKSVDIIVENTDSSNNEEDEKSEKKETKKENIDDRNRDKKPKSKKKDKPILHITAKSEPIIIGELAPEIFAKCKEMMRAVKKALKSLDRPDQSLGESEKAHHNRHCLLQIGKHIDSLLHKMHSEEKSRDWKSHLWCFVSKFTEHDAKKLYKLYRHALKKKHREKSEDPVKRVSVVDNDRKPSSSSYRSSYSKSNSSSSTTPSSSSSFGPSFRRGEEPPPGKKFYPQHNEQFNKYPRKSGGGGGTGYDRPPHHHMGSGGGYREGYGGNNAHYDQHSSMYGKQQQQHHHPSPWMGGHNGSSSGSGPSYGNNQPPPHRKHDWRGGSGGGGPPSDYR